LVVLSDSWDGFGESLSHKLAEAESLLGGVIRGILFCLAG
jgi:hypothetical protein